MSINTTTTSPTSTSNTGSKPEDSIPSSKEKTVNTVGLQVIKNRCIRVTNYIWATIKSGVHKLAHKIKSCALLFKQIYAKTASLNVTYEKRQIPKETIATMKDKLTSLANALSAIDHPVYKAKVDIALSKLTRHEQDKDIDVPFILNMIQDIPTSNISIETRLLIDDISNALFQYTDAGRQQIKDIQEKLRKEKNI